MSKAGATKWEVTDDGGLQAFQSGRFHEMGKVKGKPILYFELNNQPLVINEYQCISYDTVSKQYYMDTPNLTQTVGGLLRSIFG
jgi:hypothetical protein